MTAAGRAAAAGGPALGEWPLAARPGAVWFDLYGTLVDLAPLAAACEALAPGRGQALADRWRARQLEASWLRTVMGAWADFEAVTRDALTAALVEEGIDPPADTAAPEPLASAFERLPARSEARPVLARLRAAGVRCCVLSNGSAGMIQRTLAAAGLAEAIDVVRSVDRVERYKPDPAVYRLAVDASPAGSAVGFVTANGWDAAGAAAFGLAVAWLRPSPAAILPAVGAPSPLVATWAELTTAFAIDDA